MEYRKTIVSILLLTSLCTSMITGSFEYQILQNPKITGERTQNLIPVQQEQDSLSLAITSPANGTVFNTTNITVNWEAEENNTWIEYFNISLDGETPQKVANTTTQKTFTRLSGGFHNVSIMAVNTAEDIAIDIVYFTVNATPKPRWQWSHWKNDTFNHSEFDGYQSDPIERWRLEISYPTTNITFSDTVCWREWHEDGEEIFSNWTRCWEMGIDYHSENGSRMHASYGVDAFTFDRNDDQTFARTQPPNNIGFHGTFENRTHDGLSFIRLENGSTLLEFDINYTNVYLREHKNDTEGMISSHYGPNKFNLTFRFHIYHGTNATNIKVDTFLDWANVNFTVLNTGNLFNMTLDHIYGLENRDTGESIQPIETNANETVKFYAGSLPLSVFDLGDIYTLKYKTGNSTQKNLTSIIRHEYNDLTNETEWYYNTQFTLPDVSTEKLIHDPSIQVFPQDTVLPSVSIYNPSTASTLSKKSVTVKWLGYDNIGIDHYEITDTSGTWHRLGTKTSYQFSSLGTGTYTIKVKAVDTAGRATIAFVTFTVDNTDPKLNITNPEDGATIKANEVTVTWNGSDTIGIDHYEVSIDGESWTNVGTNENHTFSDVRDGNHPIEVKAVDGVGNTATDSITFTVSTEKGEGSRFSPLLLTGIGFGVTFSVAAVAFYVFKIKRE